MSPRKVLLDSLRGFLPNIVVREVLVAKEGLKVARTGLRRPQAQRLANVAEQNGFHVVVGHHEEFPRRDRAKGGWCNSSHDSGIPGRGFVNVYIAAEKAAAVDAYNAELSGNDLAFGSALNTPECCRRFYESAKEEAAREQNDFFPLSASSNMMRRPSALLNLGAQYFDASLVSHFPCSLSCSGSIVLAKRQARIMRKYDPAWLTETLNLLNHGCLYTEYAGIFLLPSSEPVENGVVRYSATALKGTSQGRVLRALVSGDTARQDGESLVVERKGRFVASFNLTNIRLFAPEPTSIRDAAS